LGKSARGFVQSHHTLIISAEEIRDRAVEGAILLHVVIACARARSVAGSLPVQIHAAEGSPLIPVPGGVFRSAPNSNAARLFQSFLFSVEAQQLFVDAFAHLSFHALVKERPGRTSLSASRRGARADQGD
jgi:ABC-type Fe3+ transport system substrate-binding protein